MSMVAWDQITCKRGHTQDDHHARRVDVVLGVPHKYHDLPKIPRRFARRFAMMVWDPEHHPVDGQSYCPAADCVSHTIINGRIWEPAETIIALSACKAATPDSIMLDLGCQLGWFSLLAASMGVIVQAFDAEDENLRLLRESARQNGWQGLIRDQRRRIDAGTDVWPLNGTVALAKIDLEGAEDQAIRVLRPMLNAGKVERILIEVSPCFHEGYGELIADLVSIGYECFEVPDKQLPPARLEHLPMDLEPGRLDHLSRQELVDTIDTWHQKDLVLALPGVAWG